MSPNSELSKPNSSADETQSPGVVEQLRLAMFFLTRKSVNVSGVDYVITFDDLVKAIWLFPIVGIAIGGLGAIALILLTWASVPEPVAAALSVGLIIWFTGATQEDGLANLIDGLGSGQNKEQKIDIMKSKTRGSYGILCLAIVTIAKIAAIASIAYVDIGAAAAAIIGAAVWSRSLIAPSMRWLPPIIEELPSEWTITPTEGDTWKGLVLGSLLLALMLITPAGTSFIIILIAGGASAFAIGWLALWQIQGYTVDILWSIQQVAETTVLVVTSAIIIGNIA
jgi:adenosylcobinamide-GDP ribazoletransferase